MNIVISLSDYLFSMNCDVKLIKSNHQHELFLSGVRGSVLPNVHMQEQWQQLLVIRWLMLIKRCVYEMQSMALLYCVKLHMTSIGESTAVVQIRSFIGSLKSCLITPSEDECINTLNMCFCAGLVSHSDLDDRAIEALKEFNEEGALQVLLQFKDSDLSHVQVCLRWPS